MKNTKEVLEKMAQEAEAWEQVIKALDAIWSSYLADQAALAMLPLDADLTEEFDPASLGF